MQRDCKAELLGAFCELHEVREDANSRERDVPGPNPKPFGPI